MWGGGGGEEVVVSGCSTESWEVAAMKDIRNGMKQWELRGVMWCV